LSKKLFEELNIHSSIYIITRNGTPLVSPTDIVVEVASSQKYSKNELERIVSNEISMVNQTSTPDIMSDLEEKYGFLIN
jgi:hypothetical protein